jgi:hypothetical protein
MELKRGNLFAGAIVAISLGTFAVPFASASTGTAQPRPHANSFIQLAQEEHQEVEEKSEHKVTETNDNATAPDTTTVMPGNTTVVVPETTVAPAPAPETAEKQSEHKSVDKEHDIDALGIHAKVEHHVDESNSSADHD